MAYDPSLFEAQRRALMNNYSSNTAMRGYANFISNQRSGRNLADFNEQFTKQQKPLVSSYGRRGLVGPGVRSGAFKNAMAEYAKSGIKSRAEMQRQADEGNQQYKLGMDQSTSQFQSDLADLESQKARQIQEDALRLMQMRAGI